MNKCDIGDIQTLSVLFTDSSNTPKDPTTVVCKVKTPDGVVTSYTPIRSSTGVYYYNFPVEQSGTHYYRFEGTGDVVAAGENGFIVREPNVT